MNRIIALISIFLLALLHIQCSEKKAVTISPTQPERGDLVIISYDCSAPNAKIPMTAEEVIIKFSYSTLYNLPYELPLVKNGDKWEISFKVPRYAVFSSFLFQSGNIIDMPQDKKHYELPIYKDGKLIENVSLYKAYSLSAQIGKSDSLELLQEELYKEELERYPNNFEAKVRQLKYFIDNSSKENKEEYEKKAHELIKNKLLEDPNNMGNINKVTMGYLIIGAKDWVDSTYQFVLKNYPEGLAAKELFPSSIDNNIPTIKRIEILEKALKSEPKEGGVIYKSIHQALLNAYIETMMGEKAVYHANKLTNTETPYSPQIRFEIAEKFVDKNMELSYALTLAKQSLDSVASYPIGVIRFFPEYGYILPYIEEEEKTEQITLAKSNIQALISYIYAKQGKEEKALLMAEESMKNGWPDKKVLKRLTKTYLSLGDTQKAFSIYKEILIENPTDKEAKDGLTKTYLKQHNSTKGLEAIILDINSKWKVNILKRLETKRLNKRIDPLTKIVDMQGSSISPAITKNKVVFISFWATWCSPCMKEMPYIQKVYNKYKNEPDVTFLVINSGAKNTFEDAKNWASKSGYTFPIYYNQDHNIFYDILILLLCYHYNLVY